MRKFQVSVNGSSHVVTVLGYTEKDIQLEIGGERYDVRADPVWEKSDGSHSAKVESKVTPSVASRPTRGSAGDICAPIPGIVIGVQVAAGDVIKNGATVAVIDAMKMENSVNAPREGIVKVVHVTKGQEVKTGDVLVTIE